MENASQALIIAGGILIGIVIISMGVYLFTSFGESSKSIQEQVDSRVVAEFNAHFSQYEGSTTITIHDIVSLANYAKQSNENYDLTYPDDKNNEFYAEVYLSDNTISVSSRELTGVSDYTDIINLCSTETITDDEGNLITQIKYYKVSSIQYNTEEENTRVKKIVFVPVN